MHRATYTFKSRLIFRSLLIFLKSQSLHVSLLFKNDEVVPFSTHPRSVRRFVQHSCSTFRVTLSSLLIRSWKPPSPPYLCSLPTHARARLPRSPRAATSGRASDRNWLKFRPPIPTRRQRGTHVRLIHPRHRGGQTTGDRRQNRICPAAAT
jgi:hypothetical protein